MIPKIIHYCWLSHDPYPQKIQKCMDSWRRALPDYEFRLWNFDRFPKDKSAWVSQAFDAGKYAFAADYIRNYALYTEGGIYLDTDVEVLKSFDPLLHLPYFMGMESTTDDIEAAVMGSEAGNPIFKVMLDYYDSRSFIRTDGTYRTTPLPQLMSQRLFGVYQIKPIGNISEFDSGKDKLCVLPCDYFSPIHQRTMRLTCTDNTYAIHRFAASWRSASHRYKKNLQIFLGPTITGVIVTAKQYIRNIFS